MTRNPSNTPTVWKTIDSAPLMELVLAWNPVWRQPFPAKRNGDHGEVWIDTCELEARGIQGHATHWMPLPQPPEHP